MKCFLVIAMFSLFLIGCSRESGEDYLDEYLYRLSNVLDVERVYFSYQSPLLTFPSKNPPATVPEAQAKTISLLEFLSLYGCELQRVVGSNNAILGKLAKPSQKLLYELKFLHYAPLCLEKILQEEKLDLHKKLQAVILEKRRDLPLKIWQTIALGQEMQNFWKMPSDLNSYPKQYHQETVAAIRQISGYVDLWLAGDYQTGWNEIEGLLHHVNYGDGGYLIKSLAIYQQGLERANRMIELQKSGLCVKGKPRFNQVAAQNVVQKIFVGEVQQWASSLSRRYYELIPMMDAFENRFITVETSAYRRWREQRNQLLEEAIRSSKPHVQMLEVLLKCGQKIIPDPEINTIEAQKLTG